MSNIKNNNYRRNNNNNNMEGSKHNLIAFYDSTTFADSKIVLRWLLFLQHSDNIEDICASVENKVITITHRRQTLYSKRLSAHTVLDDSSAFQVSEAEALNILKDLTSEYPDPRINTAARRMAVQQLQSFKHIMVTVTLKLTHPHLPFPREVFDDPNQRTITKMQTLDNPVLVIIDVSADEKKRIFVRHLQKSLRSMFGPPALFQVPWNIYELAEELEKSDSIESKKLLGDINRARHKGQMTPGGIGVSSVPGPQTVNRDDIDRAVVYINCSPQDVQTYINKYAGSKVVMLVGEGDGNTLSNKMSEDDTQAVTLSAKEIESSVQMLVQAKTEVFILFSCYGAVITEKGFRGYAWDLMKNTPAMTAWASAGKEYCFSLSIEGHMFWLLMLLVGEYLGNKRVQIMLGLHRKKINDSSTIRAAFDLSRQSCEGGGELALLFNAEGAQSRADANGFLTPDIPLPLRHNAIHQRHHICAICRKQTTTRCSGCHKTFYCSKGCQTIDWCNHKVNCKLQRIN